MIDEASSDTPRWVQRFRNFDGALMLLREGVELLEEPDIHPMTKEGLIQRFEFTFELAWKTLKDYLEYRKVTLVQKGPADVLRTAYATNYVQQGPVWMEALDARNELSHTYRRASFERIILDIPSKFLPVFESLHEMLLTERMTLDAG